MFLVVDVFCGDGFRGKIFKSVQCFHVIEEGKVKGWLLEFLLGLFCLMFEELFHFERDWNFALLTPFIEMIVVYIFWVAIVFFTVSVY